MYINIRERKKYVDKIISTSKKKIISSLELSPEIMSMCYILASASIEYMVESILLTWAKKITKLHQNSKIYKGRKYTQIFLEIKIETIEKKLNSFQSSDLDRIQILLKEIAGEEAKTRFDNLLKKSIDKSMLKTNLTNIVNFRHRVAHGNNIPPNENHNLDELQKNYDFIYKHLIKNLIKSLPLPN